MTKPAIANFLMNHLIVNISSTLRYLPTDTLDANTPCKGFIIVGVKLASLRTQRLVQSPAGDKWSQMTAEMNNKLASEIEFSGRILFLTDDTSLIRQQLEARGVEASSVHRTLGERVVT